MERRIVVEGREIMYELTVKKVKNLNLRVQPDGRSMVSVPRGLSPAQAEGFVISRGADRFSGRRSIGERTAAGDVFRSV